MDERDIDMFIELGWWVSVSPTVSKGKWQWTCGIYKRGKKTGNWITDNCKTHETPQGAYEWARSILQKKIEVVVN
jgi:hypothetical protein